MLIGRESVRGGQAEMRALNPATNASIAPMFGAGGTAEVDRACRLAAAAFDSYSRIAPQLRARFLDSIAENLEGLGDTLVTRCVAETGLPPERVSGEIAWAAAQLRMFARVVLRGLWRNATIDSAEPSRQPLPRVDLRMQKVPLGPVVVFGASNFPILYSVAGGDTASALASGCPVVAKAHPSHLGTSELVGRAIQKAVADNGLHEGVFSLIIGDGNSIGEALVDHPETKAVAFTGSEAGGMALVRRGLMRAQPIPVFAEMTSSNPHFVLPTALATRADTFATRFVEQMVASVGQMCLTPGIILAIDGTGFNALRSTLRETLADTPAATMLARNIHANFERGVERLRCSTGVTELACGADSGGALDGRTHLFEVDAKAVLHDIHLLDEVFGPSAILVRCQSADEMLAVGGAMRGQLSMVVHLEPVDHELAHRLLPVVEAKTGRIVINAFSNMVEISDAQVHGGPFPATSDPRFTAVGSTAIDRFLRPVAYQNFPPELLPPALRDDNPLGLWRLRDNAPGNA
jgi:NADP-dependent aldehyde dehydrogenase